MNAAERHRLVLTLFDQACDLPANERAKFLSERCSDDAVRNEVHELLRKDDSEDAFVDHSNPGHGLELMAASVLHVQSGELDVPGRFDRYFVVREVGRGGMGVIYEAEQESPKRRVALKVLRPGLLSRSLLRRFQHEAHVLGQLQHPGIAQIYEAGWTDLQQGRLPFFAMEFIDGPPIDRFIHTNGMHTHQTLELVARVCDAVQHAHQKGVIHRDLKPSNVLVLPTDHDGTRSHAADSSSTGSSNRDEIGQPKVLDFGIARVTDADLQTVTLQTEVGQLVGTLAYMSPEQLGGASVALDTRCDVYALGVMLYELVAKRRPHDLTGLALAEAARLIREQEPQRLGTLDRALRGDVETIVAKAMDKDRERRYATAAEFAADIRRFLTHQPIDARRASTWYQLRKLARRNRGLVAGLVVAILALLAGTVGTGLALVEARQQRDDAVAAKDDADASRLELETVVDFQTRMLSDVDLVSVGGDISQRLQRELARTRGNQRHAAVESDFATYLEDINMTNVARDVFKSQVVDRSCTTLDADPPNQPRTQAQMRISIARTYIGLSLAVSAIEQLDLALELLSTNDSTDPERVESAQLKSKALGMLGRHAEAVVLLEELSEALGSALGVDHDKVLALRYQIITSYVTLGRYDDALTTARELLALIEEKPGVFTELELRLRHQMAGALRDQGQQAEAERMLRDQIAIGTKRLGAEHEIVMNAENSLGATLYDLGRLEDAEALFRSRLVKLQRTLGDEHLDTAAAKNSLGMALLQLQRFPEAESLLRDALEVRRRLQPNGDKLISSQRNLAGFYYNTQRYEEALEVMQDCLPAARRTLGADHPQTLGVLSNIISILIKLERFDDAESYAADSVARCRRAYGADHQDTVNAYLQHASILGKLERHAEAVAPAATAYEAVMRARPPGNAQRVNACLIYGGKLVSAGQFESAEKILQAVYVESAAERGEGDRLTGKCIPTLFKLYAKWSEAEPNERYETEREKWRSVWKAFKALRDREAAPG